MKKYFVIVLGIILLITGGIYLNYNNMQKTKTNEIYLDNFVLAKLLDESSNSEVTFKSIYPKGADIHEYEFTQNDFKKFENSLGTYILKNNQINKLKNIKNITYLNNELKDILKTNDGSNLDTIHYVLSLKSTSQIYDKLTKYFVKYLNAKKVDVIKNKFTTSLNKVKNLKVTKNTISIHNAWTYFNNDTNSDIKTIGDHEGNLIQNESVNKILANLKENDYLLSESFEELTSNEQKIINKYKLKNLKINTFEKELKNSDYYFSNSIKNYELLSNE